MPSVLIVVPVVAFAAALVAGRKLGGGASAPRPG